MTKKDPALNRWGRDAVIAAAHEQLENYRADRGLRSRKRMIDFNYSPHPEIDRDVRELLHLD